MKVTQAIIENKVRYLNSLLGLGLAGEPVESVGGVRMSIEGAYDFEHYNGATRIVRWCSSNYCSSRLE